MAQSDDDPIKRAKALFLNQDDERALPIRLTHSPTTCRVLPFP